MLNNFLFIELFYNINYIIFSKYNYHEIFRSLSCILITISSLYLLIINYNNLFVEYTNSTIIDYNKFIIQYLIYDIYKLLYHKNYRYDLYIHHLLTIYAYYIYGGTISLLCGLVELYSSLNWLEFINKKFNLINKKFKFYTLFLRFIIWITGFIVALKYNIIGYRIICFPTIILLDIYWFNKLYKIIYKNNE
jgi:hypothetical protein